MAYISFQPNDYFNTKLYTGNNSSSNAITGVGFQPDWVWLKARNYGESHRVYDVVRGVANYVTPNSTGVESNSIPLTSFDSDGFTIGSSDGSVNGNYNYVSWNWKASGSPSSNSDGDLTSSVSVNTTAGISIGTYTSDITGVGSKTVGHGLGKTPKFIITKNRNQAGQRWGVQAPGLLTDNYILELNSTAAQSNMSGNGSLTTVSSTVFSVNYADGVRNANGSGNYIFYAFAEISGFSKFGRYVGNGNADGQFIYTGFKPAWLMLKQTGTQGWFLVDNKRPSHFNPIDGSLHPNSSAVEDTSSDFFVDFLANGFKLRDSDAQLNGNGNDYIYAAFAAEPLVSSNNIPATAR